MLFPNIEFYRTILGIDSDGIGFSKVKITLHLGDLSTIGGSMPHPKEMIEVNYKQEKNKWKILVTLPKTVTGSLVWKGKNIVLRYGVNKIVL